MYFKKILNIFKKKDKRRKLNPETDPNSPEYNPFKNFKKEGQSMIITGKNGKIYDFEDVMKVKNVNKDKSLNIELNTKLIKKLSKK